MSKRWLSALLALILAGVMLLSGCSELGIDLEDVLYPADSPGGYEAEQEILPPDDGEILREDGWYSSKSEVALYLYLYGHLPDNYLTKDEAYDLGWNSRKGNLWEVAPGMSIGGDRFGNYEGLLPQGKQYRECDVDYEGGYRSGERIVYSDDGYIYYTEDHYESFEQLYP